MVVTYDGIELENIRNESFYDCRGYNCGISKFKGLPSMDVKRNFEERWQNFSHNEAEGYLGLARDLSHMLWQVLSMVAFVSDSQKKCLPFIG